MLKIYNPATEALIKELQEDTAHTIAQKFERAVAAQKLWAKIPVQERVAIVRRFKDLVVENKERLAALTTSEVGKPLSQSRGEINGMLGRVDFFLENTEKVLKQEVVLDDPSQKIREEISLEPLGVVANISAWNYPYLVGSNVFIPALLTGNAVLYKPSEFAMLTGLALTDLFHKAGVPQDVMTCIVGTGQAGAELLKLKVAGVFFTGSYATGRRINEAAAPGLKRVQLELGGKDPIYVTEDTNVEGIAPGIADGAFYNNGQSCCSVERIYVHEKVYDRFVEAFVKEVKTYVMGDPTGEKTYIGPLTRAAQLEVLDRQVKDATAKGANILTGGKRPAGMKGYYFEPTVLVNVNHTMDVMKEESFGPIIGIQKVKDDAEALKLMNDTEYGLTAGIYSTQETRATAMMSQLNSGSVYWNCCDRVSPRLPWSGRGHSGMGATLSKYGILAFVQPKGWHMRLS